MRGVFSPAFGAGRGIRERRLVFQPVLPLVRLALFLVPHYVRMIGLVVPVMVKGK